MYNIHYEVCILYMINNVYCTGNLCPATTAHFYTRIAGIMSIYTRQPTKEQYSRVAQAVLRKYPFIRNPVNPEVSI